MLEFNSSSHPMSIPCISILLATHRSEKFLQYQLEHMAAQTIWPEAELVIVANDPSSAEQRHINRFKQKWGSKVRVMMVPRETLYASWNRGIAITQGELLAIANVDDIRTPSGLEAQVQSLRSNQSALFSYGPYTVVRHFGSCTGKIIMPPEFDLIEFTRSMHAGPFFIWRRIKDVKALFFDEQFRSGGDFDFAIRLACSGQGILVPDLLGYYYDSGQGLSTGNQLQPIERTVIELRYGIFDKLDYGFLPEAVQYNIPNLYWKGTWHRVADLVPNYREWIQSRRQQWFSLNPLVPRRDTSTPKRFSLKEAMNLLRKWFHHDNRVDTD
jgi:glycosyltransferase involved in cell wall biosynthesis